MAGKRFTVDAVFRGINKISKPARSMGRSISKFVKKSNQQIAKLGRNFKKLGSFMGKAVIGGAAVAAAAMGAAVIKTAELGDEAAKTSRRLGITAESLQELRFAADRQGVSASVLDSSFTALQKRVGELKSGTGSLFAFLKKTGDKAFIRQLKLAKNTEEAFQMITEKAATIKDPMEKAAFASAAFSRAGVDMLKFMEAGTGGISKLREEARKYGAVISNEAAANSEIFIDAMTNMKSTLSGVGKTIGSKLIPILTPLIQRFADFWAANKGIINVGIDKFITTVSKTFKFLKPIISDLWGALKELFSAFAEAVSSLLPKFNTGTGEVKKGITSLSDGIKVFAKVLTKAFEIIKFLSPFLKPFIATLLIWKGLMIAIAIVTKGWAVAQAIVNAVLTANPIGLIIIAVAALIAGIVLLVKNWDTVVAAFKIGVEMAVEFFTNLWTKIKEVAGFIWTEFSKLLDNPFFAALATIFLPFITVPALIVKHWEPIKAFFTDLWSSLVSGFDQAMNTIMGTIDKIKNLPGLKTVLRVLGVGEDKQRPETQPRPVTPQERLSRSIEENTDRTIKETENSSTLTIKDETGRAQLSKQKKGGSKIALATSGAV